MMSGEFDPEKRVVVFRESLLYPLQRENRLAELNDWAQVILESELNPSVSFELISDLASAFRLFDEALGYRWVSRLTAEFDEDPLDWCQIARWHFMPERSTPDEMRTILRYYETALERARAKNEFARYILFDICQILRDMQIFISLEKRVRVLQDLKIKREVYCQFVEGKRLNGVPYCVVDPATTARFRGLETAEKNDAGNSVMESYPPL